MTLQDCLSPAETEAVGPSLALTQPILQELKGISFKNSLSRDNLGCKQSVFFLTRASSDCQGSRFLLPAQPPDCIWSIPPQVGRSWRSGQALGPGVFVYQNPEKREGHLYTQGQGKIIKQRGIQNFQGCSLVHATQCGGLNLAQSMLNTQYQSCQLGRVPVVPLCQLGFSREREPIGYRQI